MNNMMQLGNLAPPVESILYKLLDQPSLRLVNRITKECFEATSLAQWQSFLKNDSELKTTFFKRPITNYTELTATLKPFFSMTAELDCKPNSLQPNTVANAYATYRRSKQNIINAYEALRHLTPSYPDALTVPEILILVKTDDNFRQHLTLIMEHQIKTGTTGIPYDGWFPWT